MQTQTQNTKGPRSGQFFPVQSQKSPGRFVDCEGCTKTFAVEIIVGMGAIIISENQVKLHSHTKRDGTPCERGGKYAPRRN